MLLLLLLSALSATVEVPAGAPLAPAVARLGAGDVLRLGPGVHRGSLGALARGAVEGAGMGVTVIEAAEGEPAVIVAASAGEVHLRGLTLRAGAPRCALAVESGTAILDDVALSGAACAASVEGGTLRARKVSLRGGAQALRVSGGTVEIDRGELRGGRAGLLLLRGKASLQRSVVRGPAREAAVSVAGGELTLEDVVLALPGPMGLAVSGGRVRGAALTVGGAAAGATSGCVEVTGGEVELVASELLRCGASGASAASPGARLRLRGVEVEGGLSGCIALLDGARAELDGVRCSGHGPGITAAGGAIAEVRASQWHVDPTFVVECESGARIRLGAGEAGREPCAPRASK